MRTFQRSALLHPQCGSRIDAARTAGGDPPDHLRGACCKGCKGIREAERVTKTAPHRRKEN